MMIFLLIFFFFFQAEDGIRDDLVTGVQTCALPIYHLGFAYFSLGRNDEAIAEYKEELRRSGESPAVVYELGRSLVESGKYEAAVAYVPRGAELDEANPDVL